MFEDSVFASGRQVRAGRTKWAVVGALGVQAVALGAVMAVPLLRPEILPAVFAAPKVEVVLLKKEAVKVEVKPAAVRAATGVSVPAGPVVATVRETVVGRGFGAPRPGAEMGGGVGELVVGLGMGSGPGLPVGLPGGGGPVVRAAGTGKVPRVSSGVLAGLLLAPIRPVYPAIAKAAHREGTVVVTAMINKEGRIVGLQVLSGPEMLRDAALDAVKDARYKPYLLNGEATEVETTISVNFRLGG